MVGNLEGTVGSHEGTVAFIEATNWLKSEKGISFGEVGEVIGVNRGQLNMMRINRRNITKKEIVKLLQAYPELTRFFEKDYTTLEYDKTLPEQTLSEPMNTHFYGKRMNDGGGPWPELVETQKKLIEKLEAELVEVKERLKVVEAERKTLIDIVSQRK